MSARAEAAEPADRVLLIERVFDAPRPLVFAAWTEREHLVRWGAPHGFTVIHCEAELRPGGAWRAGMRSPEGREHWNGGVYREIVPPERLVYTFAWEDETGKPGHETLVTITFAEEGEKTRMTFRQAVFQTVEDRDGHQGGWSEAFEKLAELLAQERVAVP
jgi:uncharacterized protein YndB with AHSA1/START domain